MNIYFRLIRVFFCCDDCSDGQTPTSNFLSNGHLEVFYFTVAYGLTRWEVWSPLSAEYVDETKVHATSECSGSSVRIFKNMNYSVLDCHDWSRVILLENSLLPHWPLVNANLLNHFHFDSGLSDSGGIGEWHRFGTSTDGNTMNWSILISTSGSDGNSGSGLKYLAMNCGAGSTGTCGPMGTQAIYQDIPVSKICFGCSYLVGVNARTEQGQGGIQIAAQILSENSTVLWQNVISDVVSADNGDGRSGESASIYLSSKFISNMVTIPDFSSYSVYVMRFEIIPMDTKTYYIVDAFVNRFPGGGDLTV